MTILARRISLFVILMCGIGSTALRAQVQAINGSIQGDVTDSHGALVPGADVEADETDTGIVHRAVTDGSGHFEFLSLKPPHVRQILARLAHTWERFVAPYAPDRGLPVLRGHAARARLATRHRIVPGVGEMYSVRRRLKKISTPLSFPRAGKPVGERNRQG